jgi:hypothetical protein
MVCVFFNHSRSGIDIYVAPSHVELLERFKARGYFYTIKSARIPFSALVERLVAGIEQLDWEDKRGSDYSKHDEGCAYIANFPDVPVSEDGRAWVFFNANTVDLGVATDPGQIEKVKMDIQGGSIFEVEIISGIPKTKSANKS